MNTPSRIDRDRLARTFEEISSFGATAKGGLHRLALTNADRDARQCLKRWCSEAGYDVFVDQVGSMFATRRGRLPRAPPMMIGSHLDSQPFGGRYDGAVGVIAALEVMRTLDDLAFETDVPIQLVNWTSEEGARFHPPLIASGAFAGVYDVDYVRSRTDDAGITLGAELARIGFDGPLAPGWPLTGYLEIHIEQGTVLERNQVPIGVVTGVVGIRDIIVRVRGENAHAGPLEMHLRRDALVGAAQMILEASRIGLAWAPEARVTVGRISVPSNSHSVVPGLAKFVLDIRHPGLDGLDRLEIELCRAFERVAGERRLEVAFEQMWAYPPIAFDPALQSAIEQASGRLGYRSMHLPSRAGHDAWNIARIAPAVMIFIPCRGGISHNESEYAEFDHIAASADVLLGILIDQIGCRR